MKDILGSALMISILSLFSKFLGFIREILTANVFGTSAAMDSYITARTATIIIMGTVGAALNSSMMPVLSTVEDRHGKRGKLLFFNKMVNIVSVFSIFIILISITGAPILVKIIGSQLDQERFEIAVRLTRLGMPLVFFLGLNYLYTALLQNSQIFMPPAASGIPYNLTFFIYLVFLAGDANINHLMIATVVATFFQFIIMVPSVRKLGYRIRANFRFRDKYTHQVAGMIVPVLIGSSVQQLNTVIDRTLASGLEVGSMSALSYASRVSDVVVSVFVAAITTVVFPLLTEAFVRKEKDRLIDILKKGMNIIFMITIPATAGIILLSEPLIKLFFERGAFDAKSTQMTYGALSAYSIGIIGISVRLLLNKVYYSLQDTKTPMVNGMFAVLINIVLSLILVNFMAINGLAIATSIAAILSSLRLFTLLRKRLGMFSLNSIIRGLVQFTIASLAMSLLVYLMYYVAAAGMDGRLKDLMLLATVLVAIIVYFLGLFFIKCPEFMEIVNNIKGKFKKEL